MRHPRLLFFCTGRPFPPKSGLNRRCLEMFAGYRASGYEVTLLSTFNPRHEVPWAPAAIAELEKQWVQKVHVYQQSWLDGIVGKNLGRFYYYTGQRMPLNSAVYTPPGLRRWFRRHVRALQPDIVVIVYAMWDGLRRSVPPGTARTVMETMDLTSLNQQMWAAAESRMPPQAAEVAEDVLREDFYTRLDLAVRQEEIRIYDQYDYTIAISRLEADLIAAGAPRTRVLHIPMTMPVVDCANTYSGAAIFPMGPNPFNWQGFYYLVRRVLPALLRQAPDFRLLATGSCEELQGPVPEAITLAGFLPDLTESYRQAPFLLCPVFGGTGQLVKVIEAMAHGVPAIVLEAARHRVPIRDGEDGLVARDAAEFAAHAARLWRDRALCRRLGEAARARVASEFSRQHLLEALAPVVAPA